MKNALGHGRLEDRANNFTAMRIGFAVLILYGHALMLPQGLPMTGAWAVFVDTVVQYALDGFFILSGYMLAASLFHSRDMTGYWLSRGLRIFPGLIVNSSAARPRSKCCSYSTQAHSSSSNSGDTGFRKC